MSRFEEISVDDFKSFAEINSINREFVLDQVNQIEHLSCNLNIFSLIVDDKISGLLCYSTDDIVQRLIFIVNTSTLSGIGTTLISEYADRMKDISIIYMDKKALKFYESLGIISIGKYHRKEFDMQVAVFDKQLQNVELSSLSEEQQQYIKSKISLK